MTVISFTVYNEGDADKFKSQTSQLIKHIKEWSEDYGFDIVTGNGSVWPVEENHDMLDEFEKYVDDNANVVDGEVSFPNDSPYIVKERDHNDIESGQLDIKKPLALLSPYDGQVDTLNIQVTTVDLTIDDLLEHFENKGDLDIYVTMADMNGDFAEITI